LLGLWPVLVQETEKLSGSVLVESVGELGNSGRDLESLVKNDLLSLESDIFGPFDKAGQVSGRLDVLADTKIARSLLDQRILCRFRVLAGLGRSEWSSSWLLSCTFLWLKKVEKNATVSDWIFVLEQILGIIEPPYFPESVRLADPQEKARRL